jgi:hypothetical protein
VPDNQRLGWGTLLQKAVDAFCLEVQKMTIPLWSCPKEASSEVSLASYFILVCPSAVPRALQLDFLTTINSVHLSRPWPSRLTRGLKDKQHN